MSVFDFVTMPTAVTPTEIIASVLAVTTVVPTAAAPAMAATAVMAMPYSLPLGLTFDQMVSSGT